MQDETDSAIQHLNKSVVVFQDNFENDHDNVKSVEKYLTAISQSNRIKKVNQGELI